MSDTPPSTPTPAAPFQPKPRAKRTWRRRILLALVVFLALALVARALLAIVLPPVMRSVLARYNLRPDYERTEIHLLGGDVGLWHVTLTPLDKNGAPTGEPVVRSDYCRAAISPLNLLRGRLVIKRLEADGVNLLIDRLADGSIPLVDHFISPGRAPTKTSATVEDIDLTSPLRIDAFRLSRIRARVRDQSVTPALDSVFDLNVRLDDLDSPLRPTRFELELSSTDLLDVLRIEGEGRARGQNLDADIRVFLRGLHAKPAEGYLAPLGLKPVAGDISMRLTGQVKAWPATQPASASNKGAAQPRPPIQGTLSLTGVAATADLQQAIGLSRLQLDAEAITSQRAEFSKLLIEGIRCNIRRTSDGGFWLGGMEFMPVESTTTAPAPAVAQEAVPAPVQPQQQPIIRWRLGELLVRDVRASLHDEYIQPTADVVVEVPQLSIRNIVDDPQAPADQQVATIDGTMLSPGVWRSASVTGTAAPFASTRTVDLKFLAEGIRPDALGPYLDAAGIEPLLKDASFSAALSASAQFETGGALGADAAIKDVRFSDGGEDLFRMDLIQLAGARIDPAASSIRVESIDITGPRLDGRRETSGALAMLGLRLKPAVVSTDQPQATAPPAAPTAPSIALPKIDIGRLTWSGSRVRFADEFVTPAARFDLADAGLEITGLRMGAPTTQPSEPGQIRAFLVSTGGLAERIDLVGTIDPGPAATTIDMQLTGRGITASMLAPYLQQLGISPVLKQGTLDARARATIAHTHDEPARASLVIENAKFADGSDELMGLDALRIDDVSLASNRLTVGAVEIDKPRIRAMRDRDGTLVAAGMRTLPPTTQPRTPLAVAEIPKADLTPTTQPAPAAQALAVLLNKLRIKDASLRWIDNAIDPAVDASLRADVALDALAIGDAAAGAAPLSVVVRSPGMIEEFRIDGTVSLAAGAPAAKLSFNGRGIQAGALAPYLPPGTALVTRDGRLAAKLDAGVAPHEQGGQSARLSITGVDWRDGDAGQALFKLDQAGVVVSRFDPAGRVIAVDSITASGIAADATRTGGGAIRIAGVEFAAANPAAAPAAQPPMEPTAPNLRKPLEKLPLITLKTLDVKVDRLGFVDESRPDAAPLAATNFVLRNTAPVTLLGDDPSAHPPAEFELAGRIDPLVDAVVVRTVLVPFSSEAIVKTDVQASGIRGDGLLAIAPELKGRVDGSKLTDGRFVTRAEATIRAGRRGLIDLDPARPFAIDLLVEPVEFRAQPDGPILAGIEEIRADDVRVDAGAGNVIVKSLELTRPVGQVLRDADGIHVLGWVIRLPKAGAQPTTQPNGGIEPTIAPTEPPAQIASQQLSAPPSGEIRIDRLLISGIDFKLEDQAVDPPLLVPLTGLDVEVRGLSSRATVEDRPIRFNAMLNAGKIPVVNPKGETRERELFAEADASGKISLYPQPKGWVKSSISGLELAALSGEARQADVDLGGGVFDASIDARLPGDGSIDNRVKLVFTDLKLSEGPDGPIRKTLKLSQPLDLVILAIQDPAGGITLPVRVPIEQGQLDTGAVIGSAVGAAAGVIATGIASSPLKVGMGVTSLVGLGPGDKDKDAQVEPIVLQFAPGEVNLDAASVATLASVIAQLQSDRKLDVTVRHELGAGDVSRAAIRANPSPEDCLNLAYRLQQKKAGLLALRAETAGRVRGELAWQSAEQAEPAIEQLRAIDRQLAATDDLLDRVYELLRPGADRQADRRTRASAIALGQARLARVEKLLLEESSEIDDASQRVRAIRATFVAPDESADPSAGGRVLLTVKKAAKR